MSEHSLLNDLRLGSILGTGAMGQVVRALHVPSGTPLAVKCVVGGSSAAQRGLQTELAAMASLHHHAILHLFDFGVAGPDTELKEGTAWMALELASGGTLQEHPPQTWQQVRSTVFTLLEALGHAHARNLVHRDLKPANVMILTAKDRRPGLKLADFGIARAWQADVSGPRRAGTPEYMAPEQVGGTLQGPWTDLYALGCVIWEWLTGAPPFGFADVGVLLRAHIERAPGDLSPRFDVPRGAEELVRALLSKTPSDRPSSAAEVKALLAQLGTQRPLPVSLSVPTAWDSVVRAPRLRDVHGAGLGLLGLREFEVVGRRECQSMLWQQLLAADRYQESQLVILSGPVGSGRSRLASWFCQRASELGVAQIDRTWPGETGLDDLGRRLLERADPANDPLRQRAESEVTLHPDTAYQLLLREAERGPRIVWLQDVSTDRARRRLIEAFAYARPSRPCVLVMTAEPNDERTTDLLGLPGVTIVSLPPLKRREMTTLVRDVLGLSEAATATVVDRSDGVPGLAVAWIQSWVERELLLPTPQGLTLSPDAPVRPPTPDAARRSDLQAALHAMGPGSWTIAAGALLGSRVHFEEWRALCRALELQGRSRDLLRLCRLGLVYRDHASWTFVDPGLRAVVSQPLRRGPWAEWNAAAAEVLASFEPTVERTIRTARHLAEANAPDAARELLVSLLPKTSSEDRLDDLHAMASIMESLPCETQDHRVMRWIPRLLAVANADSPFEAVDIAHKTLAHLSGATSNQGRIAAVVSVVLAIGEAYDEAEIAVSMVPDDHPMRFRALALIAAGRGQHALASARWREMSQLDGPLPGIAFHHLAQIALLEDDLDAARRYVARALELLGDERGTDATRAIGICVDLVDGEFDRIAAFDDLLERARAHGSAVDMQTAGILGVLVGVVAGDRWRIERSRDAAFQQRPIMRDIGQIMIRVVEAVVTEARRRGHHGAVPDALSLARRVIVLSRNPALQPRIDALEAAVVQNARG